MSGDTSALPDRCTQFPIIVPIIYLSPCISRITYFKPLYSE
nr:MAG TPA: hypothetical protein [Bacteriophage sp.]